MLYCSKPITSRFSKKSIIEIRCGLIVYIDNEPGDIMSNKKYEMLVLEVVLSDSKNFTITIVTP